MERVKELLEMGYYNVIEVVWEVGFFNWGYFVVLFCKKFGVNFKVYLLFVK